MNADRGTTPRSIPLLRLNSQKLTKLLSSLLLKTTGRHLRRPGKGYSAGHLMLWMLQFFLVSPSYYPDCQCLLFFAGEVMPKSDKLLRKNLLSLGCIQWWLIKSVSREDIAVNHQHTVEMILLQQEMKKTPPPFCHMSFLHWLRPT